MPNEIKDTNVQNIKKTFSNKNPIHMKTLMQVLNWKLTSQKVKWDRDHTKPNFFKKDQFTSNDIAVTFVNHATCLLQVNGVNILTDPHWSLRASPFQLLGPRRFSEPGIAFDDLPEIDIILISHNHYDHLDTNTLKKIFQKHNPKVYSPFGDGHLIQKLGSKNNLEMLWWQSDEYTLKNKSIEVHFVPAQHWSARSLSDKNKSLWGGFFIKVGEFSVYFAGDTGYADHFKEIKSKLNSPDLSLLPIGAYEPRWFMKDFHMNPADAVQAHLDLESRYSLAIHHGTFQLTDEGRDEPVIALNNELQKKSVKNDVFFVLKNGESRVLK